MSRINWAKWVLPNVINPPTSTCWAVPVPDDPFHKAAFLGAIAALGSAYKWADDPDHKAKDVALVWQAIADDLQKCMDVPPSIISIEEWEEEMSLHCNIRWTDDGVLQVTNGCDCDGNAIWADVCGGNGGSVPPGTVQPGSGTRPDPGQSTCFNVLLNASNQWLLPFGVNEGDTVTITAADGAWSDGTLLWNCPDGTPFSAGLCIGAQYHEGGDPDSTNFHMQAIAEIDGQFFPASNGSFVVPTGSIGSQMIIYANDGDRSDNAGSISFRVCVENTEPVPEAAWCKVLDFTLYDYGFTAHLGVRAAWTFGLGWGANTGGPKPGDIQIHAPTFTSTNFTRAIAYFSIAPGAGGGYDLAVDATPIISDLSLLTIYDSGVVAPIPGTDLFSLFSNDATGDVSYAGYMTKLVLYGTGENPFGADNC